MSALFKTKKALPGRRILFLLLTLVTPLSFAGTRDGGGGNGIIIENSSTGHKKPYLLDLFEYGVHEAPIFNTAIPTNPIILARVNNALLEMSQPIRSLVAQKLSEIYEYDNVTAVALLKCIEIYTWRLINANLTDIEDDDGSDVDIDRSQLIQLAIRNSHTIRISKPRFDMLDQENASALVIHEVVYAMLTPQNITDGNHTFTFQPSRRAREITGYFYSPYFKAKGADGFFTLVGGALPMRRFLGDLLILEFKNSLIGIREEVLPYENNERKNLSSVSEISQHLCHEKDRPRSQRKLVFGTTEFRFSFSDYDKSPTSKQTYIFWYPSEFNIEISPIDYSKRGQSNCESDMEQQIETQLKKLEYRHDLF